jgi:hypothetical protein
MLSDCTIFTRGLVVGGRMENAWCAAMKRIYMYILPSNVVSSLLLFLYITYFSVYVRMQEQKEFFSFTKECWYFIYSCYCCCLCLCYSCICRFLHFGLSYRLHAASFVFFLAIITIVRRTREKKTFLLRYTNIV